MILQIANTMWLAKISLQLAFKKIPSAALALKNTIIPNLILSNYPVLLGYFACCFK